ncbi:MAG: hypothetical protein JST47_10590 [Bacteroidetes bacterium]|nr:hypothetical protein [Bacteroidota bacterium]MBS1972734.1 hypothetical protein [Bacteroidota bacterium]
MRQIKKNRVLFPAFHGNERYGSLLKYFVLLGIPVATKYSKRTNRNVP